MKKIALVSILMLGLPVLSVEQKYMPDGYVRDDTITPYYKTLTNRYFQKVDSGQIKCDYNSYRKEVVIPLDKITNQLKRGETPEIPKTFSNEHNLHP